MQMRQTVQPVFVRSGASPAGPQQPQHVAQPTVRSTPIGAPGAPASWTAVPTGSVSMSQGPGSKPPARPCSKGPPMQEQMAFLQRPNVAMDQSPGRMATPSFRESDVGGTGRCTLEPLEDEVQQLKQRLGEALDELPRLREENAALKEKMELTAAGGLEKVEVLEKSLAEEVEARCELERVFGKDLRDYVKAEMEHAREMMMREMRERMDGQKVLREEVQLQQQALASFTGRVDEAIIELRTELPRLGQEAAATKGGLEALADREASLAQRVEALEKGLAEECQERCAGLKNLSKESRESLAHEAHSNSGHFAELRKQMDELNSRMEASSVALGKGFREHVAGETERVTSQVAELKKLHNELRLRTDVSHNLLSKDLRDHIALEVERVTAQMGEVRRLLDEQGSRADEAQKALGKDLREHVALESKDLRDHLLLEREQKEKEVAELRRLNNELGSRMDTAHSELGKDLRDYVALETERMAAQLAELKRPLDELGLHTDSTLKSLQSVHEQVDQLSHDLSEARCGINRLEEQLTEAQGQSSQQASELERKIIETDGSLRSCIESTVGETKSGLRSWVDTTVVNRVTSLDRGLRTEMDERSSAIQQLVAKVSHNAERWCQLQAKFDNLLVEVNRANRPAQPPGSTPRSCLSSSAGVSTCS